MEIRIISSDDVRRCPKQSLEATHYRSDGSCRCVPAARPEPEDDYCAICAPFACDDPDRHLGVPSEYTPLRNRGCHCGADFDGRDCMCFEE